MGGRRLDHGHTDVWDPDIVGSRAMPVCYVCLCLMSLFPGCDVINSSLGRVVCMDWD